MRALIILLASAGFIGYIPVASGTFGSLAAIPLFFGYATLSAASVTAALVLYAVLVAGGCWIAGQAEHVFAEHDSHKIVLDEVLGYLAATMFLAPTWQNALVAFFIFRVFDVIKPFPAGYIDKHLPGGRGVVLDDVVSGIYANLATRLVVMVL
jgi:phosphatidylglycerophosphatase A